MGHSFLLNQEKLFLITTLCFPIHFLLLVIALNEDCAFSKLESYAKNIKFI